MTHQLYETKDKDRPYIICDSNGEVVLSLCKICGGAEASLPIICPGRKLTNDEMDLIALGRLDFKPPIPVMVNGKIENFMFKVDGKSFRCKCECNVFYKPDSTNLNLIRCNSCPRTYEGEK